MALFDATRFRFAMDAAPRLPSVAKPVPGEKKPPINGNGQDHAAKYPGSFGNPECYSKNPKGCPKHKTGEFASPGSPYAAKDAGGPSSPAATASAVKPAGKFGVKSGGDKIQEAIDKEKDPAKKKAMQKFYTDFLAKKEIKELIAAHASAPGSAGVPPAEAASSTAPAPASKPIPAPGDHAGWKSLYAEIRDENKARFDADYKAGKMTKEQWADAHAAEDEKFAAKTAKYDKAAAATGSAGGPPSPAASAPAPQGAEKPKPQPEVKFTGAATDAQKKEAETEMAKLNKAFADAGLTASVSEVRTSPFDTRYVFHHDGALTFKELSNLRAKYGSPDLRPKLVAADTYSLVIPRARIADVSFKDVAEESGVAESAAKMSAPCLFGRGRDGKSVVRDIADMHHLLIGGKTGEGKSSVLNSLLVGAMRFKSPDDLEIYTIDPQKVEFDAYANMPHVTRSASGSEPGDVAAAVDMLDDCLAEMRHRTQLFATLGNGDVKNLRDYRAYRAAHPGLKLPNIRTRLVAIDEFPMLVNDPAHGAAIAAKVKSLANLSRKAGIHLVVAAQDPKLNSVGDIKGQMTKVALKTANSQASRNILGMNGAETLTGRGDMFIQGAGDNTSLERAKGAFVGDVKSELDGIAAKWGKKKPAPATASSGSAGVPPAGESPSVASAPPSAGNAPAPQPGLSGKTSDEYRYPNTNQPVDISHLGFFSAMAEALKQGWKGNKVTYDPHAYKRMGAEKWRKHLDAASGAGRQPDYSQHLLAQTLPVPEAMNEAQRTQFQKWCAAYNDAVRDTDPNAERRVFSQYRSWYRQNGFDDAADIGRASTAPNPYQKWIDRQNRKEQVT